VELCKSVIYGLLQIYITVGIFNRVGGRIGIGGDRGGESILSGDKTTFVGDKTPELSLENS
jgi:hypothetical protein